jgi:hypothetical protein
VLLSFNSRLLTNPDLIYSNAVFASTSIQCNSFSTETFIPTFLPSSSSLQQSLSSIPRKNENSLTNSPSSSSNSQLLQVDSKIRTEKNLKTPNELIQTFQLVLLKVFVSMREKEMNWNDIVAVNNVFLFHEFYSVLSPVFQNVVLEEVNKYRTDPNYEWPIMTINPYRIYLSEPDRNISREESDVDKEEENNLNSQEEKIEEESESSSTAPKKVFYDKRPPENKLGPKLSFPEEVLELYKQWTEKHSSETAPPTSSLLHLTFAKLLKEGFLSKLPKEGHNFTLDNEYSGLTFHLFPVDIAIKYKGNVVAFLEIDGMWHQSHSFSSSQQLRNADQFKQFLYQTRHPSIPFYRVNKDKFVEAAAVRDELLVKIVKHVIFSIHKEKLLKTANSNQKKS